MTILLYNDGRLLIDDGNPLEGVSLDGLVACVTDPQAGDLLTYNGTMWVNAQPVLDATVTDPQEGDVLTYDGAKWVNAQPTTPETTEETEPSGGDE